MNNKEFAIKVTLTLSVLLLGCFGLTLFVGCSQSWSELRKEEMDRYEAQRVFWPYYCKQSPCDKEAK